MKALVFVLFSLMSSKAIGLEVNTAVLCTICVAIIATCLAVEENTRILNSLTQEKDDGQN